MLASLCHKLKQLANSAGSQIVKAHFLLSGWGIVDSSEAQVQAHIATNYKIPHLNAIECPTLCIHLLACKILFHRLVALVIVDLMPDLQIEDVAWSTLWSQIFWGSQEKLQVRPWSWWPCSYVGVFQESSNWLEVFFWVCYCC